MSVTDHATFLDRLKRSGVELETIYDIGANTGRWTGSIAEIYPKAKYELFEPLYTRVDDVTDNFSLGDDQIDFSMHAISLSNSNGSEQIKLLGDNGVGSSTLILDSDFRKDTKIIEVPCWQLDTYASDNGLSMPDFIKLDTQASEVKILTGADECLKHAKYILTETWMRKVYGPETPLFQDIATFLSKKGFQLYEILIPADGRDADGTLRWFDAVFINKFRVDIPENWY